MVAAIPRLLLFILVLENVLGDQKLEQEVDESQIHFRGVYYLQERGDMARVNGTAYDDIKYFCFVGSEPHLSQFWASVSFKLDLASSDYQVGSLF